MTITAIETRYAGCRFRSRLEARWAVALDTARLKWEYEPEGFETPCGRYLPDFRVDVVRWHEGVDAVRCWLEIKPEDYDIDPTDLGRWISVSRGTGLMLIVCCGLGAKTIVITPEHTYAHLGRPYFSTAAALDAGRSARFEHGEQG